MVGNNEPISTERDGFLCITGMQDALDDERALPGITEAGDLVPGEGAAALTPSEVCHLVGGGVLTRILPEVSEHVLPMPEIRLQPGRAGRHIHDGIEADTVGQYQPISQFAWPLGARGHVNGDY